MGKTNKTKKAPKTGLGNNYYKYLLEEAKEDLRCGRAVIMKTEVDIDRFLATL